jgi:hypothetical protein
VSVDVPEAAVSAAARLIQGNDLSIIETLPVPGKYLKVDATPQAGAAGLEMMVKCRFNV